MYATKHVYTGQVTFSKVPVKHGHGHPVTNTSIMYIKDDIGWSKDTDELYKLRKILSRISMNNYRTVPDWRTAHPDCEVLETRNYDFCYKMMRAILGDVEDQQIKMDNKIIKTMAKELFVEK